MYTLIIGYNDTSINLIKQVINKDGVIFLVDNKEEQDIKLRSKNMFYNQVNIKDMKRILEISRSTMLGKIFIVTEDDYLNLMIEETLREVKNVQAIYTNSEMRKISVNGESNLYLYDFFNNVLKEGSICLQQ